VHTANSRNAKPQNFIGDKHRVIARGRVERWIRDVPRTKSARFGFIKSSMWFRNARIELEESQTSHGEFMGVRLCLDPDAMS